MKYFLFLSAIFVLTVAAQKCGSGAKSQEPIVYKAKLETKAICMNYTLRLTEGKLDTSLIVADWTDESTQKSYKNVFALGNPCNFPSSIQQGDEFSFVIDSIRKPEQCLVCMAYYPTPPKKLFITVINPK